MKVAIAGASGFIGKHLTQLLRELNCEIIPLRRKDFREDILEKKIIGCCCIVNLAGESIAGIWTKRKRERIYNSRVKTTTMLVDAVNRLDHDMDKFINVSGVGVYDRIHRHEETSIYMAENFLGSVITDWEGALQSIASKKTKIVILRLGIVLSKSGGIMEKLLIPFRLGVGIMIKSEEYFPFIHERDLVRVLQWAIMDTSAEGVINVVAPEKATIQSFFTGLCDQFHVKVRIKTGPWLLKMAIGKSSSILTEGQDVTPKRLIEMDFRFTYRNIDEVLKTLLEN